MKIIVLAILFLSYVWIIESLSVVGTFLVCPRTDGIIECNEVKCCPSNKMICCPDKSRPDTSIPFACASISPKVIHSVVAGKNSVLKCSSHLCISVVAIVVRIFLRLKNRKITLQKCHLSMLGGLILCINISSCGRIIDNL